ncbi:hypothetical protein EDD94_0823 [Streptomyces sp. PanSC9]|nr:hypothetical protein EDD94_0823 [Streptomyces sp. PanSC9]
MPPGLARGLPGRMGVPSRPARPVAVPRPRRAGWGAVLVHVRLRRLGWRVPPRLVRSVAMPKPWRAGWGAVPRLARSVAVPGTPDLTERRGRCPGTARRVRGPRPLGLVGACRLGSVRCGPSAWPSPARALPRPRAEGAGRADSVRRGLVGLAKSSRGPIGLARSGGGLSALPQPGGACRLGAVRLRSVGLAPARRGPCPVWPVLRGPCRSGSARRGPVGLSQSGRARRPGPARKGAHRPSGPVGLVRLGQGGPGGASGASGLGASALRSGRGR